VRKGFTLLELIVVVGIMGFLGFAAIAGYNALQRGMAERSAGAVASTLLRAAQERAHVDRQPTVVFCYNRLLKEPSGSDENGVVVGVMTAVRRSGRITLRAGSCLYDEFADLDTTYEATDDETEVTKSGTRRLFRLRGGSVSSMDYSIVSDCVICKENAEDVRLYSDTANGGRTNLMESAFFDVGGGTISASGWNVGDGYAFEFAEAELPSGFIFGSKVPSQVGKPELFKAIRFMPDGDENEKVEIYRAKPDASGWPKAGDKSVATGTSDSTKAV